jgi:hypothetical protein
MVFHFVKEYSSLILTGLLLGNREEWYVEKFLIRCKQYRDMYLKSDYAYYCQVGDFITYLKMQAFDIYQFTDDDGSKYLIPKFRDGISISESFDICDRIGFLPEPEFINNLKDIA